MSPTPSVPRVTPATTLLSVILSAVMVPVSASGQLLEPALGAPYLTVGLPGETTGSAVGDFNGDGRPDVAVSIASPPSVAVYLSDAVGIPVHFTDLAVPGTGTCAVAAGDLNRDGVDDLVVLNRLSGTHAGNLVVFYAAGGGTFDPGPVLSTSCSTPFGGQDVSIYLVDVNGDDLLDILSPNPACATISIRYGSTTASDGFESPQNVGTGYEPVDMAVADYDGDGRLDIAAALENTDGVAILLAQAEGGFTNIGRFFAGGGGVHRIAAADFDEDGVPDLVVTRGYSTAGGASWLRGTGDGRFSDPVNLTGSAFPQYPVLAADLNEDGHADVLEGTSGTLFLGHGDGTFASSAFACVGSYRPVLADLNRDGHLDVLKPGTSVLGVNLGNGNGTFGVNRSTHLDYPVETLRMADLEEDNDLDLIFGSTWLPQYSPGLPIASVASTPDSGQVLVMWGRGDGTFGPAYRCVTTTGITESFDLGDLDGDGVPDLVALNYTYNGYNLAAACRGHFWGFFWPPYYVRSVGLNSNSVHVLDVDLDGNRDALIAEEGASKILVMMGDGTGDFPVRNEFAAGGRPRDMDVGDLNGDGYPDVAAVSYYDLSTSILYNDGAGGFAAPVILPLDNRPTVVQIGDLNNDGLNDVVVGPPLTMFPGEPGGVSTLGQPVGGSLGRFELVDFDGDGLMDIVGVGGASDGILVWRGRPDGTFVRGVGYGAATVVDFAVGDINSDGKNDIAAINSGNNVVLMLSGAERTAVDVLTFTVTRVGETAVLRWSEPRGAPGNRGYHVYRGGREPGRRITESLLQGHDEYAFVDSAPPRQATDYWIAEIDRKGATTWHGPVTVPASPDVVPPNGLAASPNPFRGRTSLSFRLTSSGAVTLTIFDLSGREVRKLTQARFPAGLSEVAWDGRDHQGRWAPAGIYLMRLRTETGNVARKVVKID